MSNNKLNDINIQDVELVMDITIDRKDRIEKIEHLITKAIELNQNDKVLQILRTELKDEKSKLRKDLKYIEKVQKEIYNNSLFQLS
jgi:hypothetical protein